MPGGRDRNLRQGDLAEQLGILLLQGISAVAPVPRTEDIGIDVISTLLRREGSRRLVAEDSFYVQLKSSSVTEVRFHEEEIAWFRSLELPFFIGAIDLSGGTIQLYAAHSFYERQSTWFLDVRTLRIVLAPGSPVGWDADGELRVHLGPPVLEWTLSDLTDDVFLQNAYAVLKAHLRLIQSHFMNARSGFHVKTEWQTGELPMSGRQSQSYGALPALHSVLDHGWPVLHGWYFQLRMMRRADDADSLLQLMERMEELGWKIPQDAVMMRMFNRAAAAIFAERSSDTESAIVPSSPPSTSG